MHYLGFIVSNDGLQVNPEKVRASADFPTPKNVKGIQSFLGLVGYFRHFIKGFAQRARPLYELLKKEADFVWTSSQENAFQELKTAVVEAPVLAFPDFDKEFILIAIGAILIQIGKHGKEHLISCHSGSWCRNQLR